MAAGAGVAIVPQDTRCIQQGGVVYKRLIDALAVSALHLAYRPHNPDQHVANLRQLLTRNGLDFARKSAKLGAPLPLE